MKADGEGRELSARTQAIGARDWYLQSTETSSTVLDSSEAESGEIRRTELSSHEVVKTETSKTEFANTELRESYASRPRGHEFIAVGATGAPRSTMLPVLPAGRAERDHWFKELAGNAGLAIAQLRAVGVELDDFASAFSSVVTGETDVAHLIRGDRSNEIVCRDRSLAGTTA